MTCYHPSYRYDMERGGAVAPPSFKNHNGGYLISNDEYINLPKHLQAYCVQIPCGLCVGCRMESRRVWALRCMDELKYHDCACFVTLTYSDTHLHTTALYLNDDGEFESRFTLCKSDYQRFFKRLRKHFSDCNIRYLLCGEYGDKSSRPHFHAIIFGIDFSDDRKLLQHTDSGDYYYSDTLDRLWGCGHCVIGDVSFQSCSYVAGYVMKKKKGSSERKRKNLQRKILGDWDIYQDEFIAMSRRPGIGADFVSDNAVKLAKRKKVFVRSKYGDIIQTALPRYYKKRLSLDGDLDAQIRSKKRNKLTIEQLSRCTDLSFPDYLKTLEDIHDHKSIKRSKHSSL